MNFRLTAGACCIATLLPFAHSASGFDFGEGQASLGPSKVLFNANGSYDHWKGVGRIAVKNGMHCTATLIDTRASTSLPATPAYAITSGHCISRKNGVMLSDSEAEGTVKFNFFTDSVPRSYPVRRITWSSMQGVDLAIVELQPTLDSLIADGVQPLRLASELPAAGRDVLWVGAPLYKDTGHLRMAACVHTPSAEIISQPWVWRHSVSNQCKDVDTGASGSPLLLRDTNEIYAAINLVTDAADPDMPPGEDNLSPGYPPLAPDSVFASPVVQLNQCFVDGVLSTDPAQCSLFPTFSVYFDGPAAQPRQVGKVRVDANGKDIYPRWALRFTVDKPFYRYKKADSALLCESPVGYGPALSADNAAIDDPVDDRIGINWLCLIGLSAADERPSLGMMRNALTLAMELQPAGPTPAPQPVIEETQPGFYTVHWPDNSSQIDHYTVKIGPPATTDCSDPQDFRRRSNNLILQPASLPKKICTYAHDVNGQPSGLREDVVTHDGVATL